MRAIPLLLLLNAFALGVQASAPSVPPQDHHNHQKPMQKPHTPPPSPGHHTPPAHHIPPGHHAPPGHHNPPSHHPPPYTPPHSPGRHAARKKRPVPHTPGCQHGSFKHHALKTGGYECVRVQKHCSGYFDHNRHWRCCPHATFFSQDAHSGVGRCCPHPQHYSVDRHVVKPKLRGSCCAPGTQYHWNVKANHGQCLPVGHKPDMHAHGGHETHTRETHTHTTETFTRDIHGDEGYGHPQNGHGHPGNGHGHPQNGHGHPGNGHGHPQNGHGHPTNGHGHPDNSHGHPKPNTDHPPAASCSRKGCCTIDSQDNFHGDRVIVAFGSGDSWFFDVPGKANTRNSHGLPKDLEYQFTRNDDLKVEKVYDLSISPDNDGIISYRSKGGKDIWHITAVDKYRQLAKWIWWQSPGNHTRPGCIMTYNFTLGHGSTFYAKSDFGHRWSGELHEDLHEAIQKRLSDCKSFAPTTVALGIKDAFVLIDRQGQFAWHLNKDYLGLSAVLSRTKKGNLQYVALHPTLKDNWFVQFKDGSVKYKVPAAMSAHVSAATKGMRKIGGGPASHPPHHDAKAQPPHHPDPHHPDPHHPDPHHPAPHKQDPHHPDPHHPDPHHPDPHHPNPHHPDPHAHDPTEHAPPTEHTPPNTPPHKPGGDHPNDAHAKQQPHAPAHKQTADHTEHGL